VTVAPDAPGAVTVTVCRRHAGRRTGASAQRTARAKAPTTRIVVAVRRLRRGRYAVVVQGPTGSSLVRTTKLT
jgi:hypothetical protein